MSRRRTDPTHQLPEKWVSTPHQVAEFVDYLRTKPRFGFDTEFIGENLYRPELCLVQIATDDQLTLIDPLTAGSLSELWKLFLEPERTVVVFAGREDVRICQHQCGTYPVNLFDLQIAAALAGYSYPIGYSGLVSELFSSTPPKGETLTNWRHRPLSTAQIRYAYDDVRYLLPAYDRLNRRLERLKRLDWANEEFQTLIRTASDDDPAAEKWRKIKGSRGLRRRELAVVRALSNWREEYAEQMNRPARYLLKDEIIVELAKRPPSCPDDIRAYRNVPRGSAEKIYKEVIKAVSLPAADYPELGEQDINTPQINQLANLLGIVLNDFCERNFLAPNFVATSNDVKSLVRAKRDANSEVNGRLGSGWRAEIIRPMLESVLDGQLVIRVGQLKSRAPLEFLNSDQFRNGPTDPLKSGRPL